MSTYPVDKAPAFTAVDALTAYRSVAQPLRIEENALMAATILDISPEETRARIEAGGHTDVLDARRRIEDQNKEGLTSLLESQFNQAADSETSASLIHNQDQKRKMWNKTGDNLYLEAALSLNNPDVDADIARFLTNLQIGEEAMQAALAESEDETGVGGYIWDFVDRYFLRALVIGGFEDITGRSVRGGREHMANLALSDPEEYARWISEIGRAHV